MAHKTAEIKPVSTLALLIAIRDSQCAKHAERQLLDALALRCRPDQRHMAYPSYATLAEDTGLGVKTLRRAAQGLVDADLITRVERPHRSNKFFLNVGLILSKAVTAREAKLRLKSSMDAEDCPYPELAKGVDADIAVDHDSEYEGLGESPFWMTGGAQ